MSVNVVIVFCSHCKPPEQAIERVWKDVFNSSSHVPGQGGAAYSSIAPTLTKIQDTQADVVVLVGHDNCPDFPRNEYEAMMDVRGSIQDTERQRGHDVFTVCIWLHRPDRTHRDWFCELLFADEDFRQQLTAWVAKIHASDSAATRSFLINKLTWLGMTTDQANFALDTLIRENLLRREGNDQFFLRFT
jgi:hypothetical protein